MISFTIVVDHDVLVCYFVLLEEAMEPLWLVHKTVKSSQTTTNQKIRKQRRFMFDTLTVGYGLYTDSKLTGVSSCA